MSPFHAFILLLLCQFNIIFVMCGTKSKPHPHQGVLLQYDGKHIPYTISIEQDDKLNAGHPVIINERQGSNGRGIVLQDIAAPPNVCLDRISDLTNYPKVVPKVKKVQIYEQSRFENGTTRFAASFEVGVSLLSFGYYVLVEHEPRYHTFTWTLDYRYFSDFDDSVGHWQVMPHPEKKGWSRVLYSTAVRLPSWVPEFVIAYVTKSALVEATTWVRKEAEKVVALPAWHASIPPLNMLDVGACFVRDEALGEARYETRCADEAVAKLPRRAGDGVIVMRQKEDKGTAPEKRGVDNIDL